MDSAEFKAEVDAIGDFPMMILLSDGSRHITQSWSVEDERVPGFLQYVDMHSMSTGHRMSVPFAMVTGVMSYASAPQNEGVPLTREQFIEALNSIRGRVQNPSHRVLILLSDGGAQIVSIGTIDHAGSERTTYRDVHFGSRLYLATVPYSMIVGVVDSSPLKLVSG